MAQRLNINKLFFCHGAELALLLGLIGLFPAQSFGGESAYEQQVMLARSGNYQPLLDTLKRQQMQGGLSDEKVADWLQVASWAGRDEEVVSVWQRYQQRVSIPSRGIASAARSYRNLRRWTESLALWGYRLAFTLNDGLANVRDLDNIPRLLISGNPSLKAFASTVTRIQETEPVRVMHVDLDYVYDSDPAQQTKNIDALVQRVYDMKISHVFLQAFSDPAGDGNIKSLYFPNRWLPVRADLFNFVSWQLQTRGGVKVYAWLPVLSFDLNASLPRVERWDTATRQSRRAHSPYLRLSPWNKQVRSQIADLYQDLSRYATFDGILFHDDALLTDFEDSSQDALAAYRRAGFAQNIADIYGNTAEFQRWTRFKSQTLVGFTRTLTQAVKDIRGPQIKTARNIFALPILEPESEAWFAQNFDDFLAAYDWTVPMAMPLMESVPPAESNDWLTQIIRRVAAKPLALNKTIFELQARDWSSKGQKGVADKQLVEWMRLLQLNGVMHYGYYPDDFINNQPDISRIRPEFSSWWYPDND